MRAAPRSWVNARAHRCNKTINAGHQQEILEGDGVRQRQARQGELSRNEVDQKRVGQPGPGELRVLRWKIAAGEKPFDDADVQRQVIPIDIGAGVHAISGLVHRAAEDHRQHCTKHDERPEANQRLRIAARQRRPDALHRRAYVGGRAQPVLSPAEQSHWRGDRGGAQRKDQRRESK